MQHPWLHLMHFVDSVDTTMNAVRAHASQGAPHGTTVVARAQSQARGRRGRTWSSPPGHGLTMTTLLRPGRRPALHTLSLVAGVAVRRAAMALGAQHVQLKWPNDVWVGERKLAGILLEADGLDTDDPCVLVGLGVNVAQVATSGLPQEVRDLAIGLLDAGASLPPAADAAQALEALRLRAAHEVAAALCELTRLWSERGLEAILAEWASADVLATQNVRAEMADGWVEGIACGVDAAGQLQISTASGMRAIQSGVVERVRPQKNGPAATPLA